MSWINSNDSSPYSALSHARKFLIVRLFCFPKPAIFIASPIASVSAANTSSHVGKRALSSVKPLSRLISVVFCDNTVKRRQSRTFPAPSRVGTPSNTSSVSDMISAFSFNSNCFLPHLTFLTWVRLKPMGWVEQKLRKNFSCDSTRRVPTTFKN